MPNLAQLPAELQIDIFGYLGSVDLKSVRSVCQTFRSNSSPALFRTIVACCRYQAMGAFQNISLHPVFAPYVNEIIFDGSVYDYEPATDESLYHRLADAIVESRGFGWQRHARFKRYQELFREQEDIQNSGVLLQTVARALDWMKNITTVIYSPGPHCIPIEAKLVRDLLPRGVVDRGNYNEWSIRPRIPSQHGIHHLIAAFYTANYTSVRVFRMNRPNLPRSNGRRIIGETKSISNFKFPRPNDIIAAKHFFCRLHTLTLNMSLLGARSASDSLDALSHLAFLLSSARDLRELGFHLIDWDCEPHHAYGHIIPDGQPIFSYLGLSAKWPHLQKISLEGVYATQEELQSIMRRNGKTLSEVRFGFCSLLAGHWSNLVDDVVYSSRVSTFALDHVNEAFIQGVPFHQLDEVDRSRWQYVGELKLDSVNERYFDQSRGKSVYDWRELTDDDSEDLHYIP